MKPFLPLFPYIQVTYLSNNYDAHVCSICPCNSSSMAEYQCKSSYLRPPSCSKCMVVTHWHLPFHRIEQWNGRYFQRTSLQNLGLIFYLGHSGDPCPNQLLNTIWKLTIVDVNGYHEANFKFCFCRNAELDEAKQLFCHLLFPATIKHPETVFTTEVLDNFDVHHSTSMKLAESFCAALQKMSAPELPDEVSVSTFSDHKIVTWHDFIQDPYRTFMQASHIHWHLQGVHRSGQAHNIDDFVTHRWKNCIAVHCPACPEPGWNIDLEVLQNTNESER